MGEIRSAAETYDEDALNELCSKVDLLEYASTSMEFERRGGNRYAAHCPLHVDKTPSLIIYPNTNSFYCFSCGVGGNMINWLMTFEDMKFPEAIDKVSSLAGTDIKNLKQCSALTFFKSQKKQKVSSNKIQFERKILDPSYMEQFDDEVPQEWIDEGIDSDVMREFGIRIDKASNRIVYPVYDNNFNLIGVKGRTRFPNYKEMKIQKYMNYQGIGTTDYFSGMKENYQSIVESGSVIIFEGIKSVMKMYGWGYKNVVAAETYGLNDSQVLILIQMGLKEVTIANDKGISMKKIREFTKTLRRFTNVYAVIDRHNLLEDKMAPCDMGKEVWDQLYSERVKL